MNELITTFSGTLNGESQPLVNASDLHQVLGSGWKFSDWIKKRIETYGFTEGEDFISNYGKSMFGRPKTEYHLSLDMAKELCLVENTEPGKKARRYFIEVEKQARQHIPAFLRRGHDGLGSPAEHQLAVMRAVVLESKPIWAKLKRYFEANLTQREMATLLNLSESTTRQHLRHMALAGLVQYATNPKLSAAGRLGYAKKQTQLALAV